jgi:hypothetical protein
LVRKQASQEKENKKEAEKTKGLNEKQRLSLARL